LWTTAAAQRRANWISLAIGVLLAITGLSALWGMWSLDVDTARRVEDAMAAQRAPIEEIQREASSHPTATQSDARERTSAQTQNP